MVDDSPPICRLQGRSDATPGEEGTMTADEGHSDETDGGRDGGSSGLAGFALGVVFGAVLGAGFALLYAPDRGEKTRRELKRRLNRLREDAEDGLDRAGQKARKELSRRRRRLEAGIDRATDRVRDAIDE
jgi:gas vesicle protein